MSSRDEEDSYQNIKDKQGTTVIMVAPNQGQNKKSKRRSEARRGKLPKMHDFVQAYPDSDIPDQESKDKDGDRNS